MRTKRPPVAVLFFLSVLITIVLFYLMGALIAPRGRDGALLVIGIVLSLQISFLTALFINKTAQSRGSDSMEATFSTSKKKAPSPSAEKRQ